ncbi:hypothetical protein FRC07_013766 [Ceratobasidium sp. 392]|nr:hypothetical protein FRC07_013766 [Ceratobasidium sp. 392]
MVLRTDADEVLWPTMVKQARISMQRLIHNPDNAIAEIRWLTVSNILFSVYGYKPGYPSDDLVDLFETAVRRLCEAAIAGNFYVNTIPWLKFVPSWLPGAGWKRKANAWRAEKERMINEPYDWTKSQVAAGVATPSILKTLLTKMDNNPAFEHADEEEEDIIKWVVGTLYAAMILYPDVQKKAQAELDAVLEEEQMPELSDRESLPYMDCVLKEVARWNSATPLVRWSAMSSGQLGVAHASSQDDQYRSFRIPKGAIVIGNTWAISNDPSVYPEPRRFNPDRFLDPAVPAAPAFGFGRR